MGDKNVELMVERLSPIAAGWVTTAAHSDRAVPPSELAARIRPLTTAPVLVAETVEDALDMARADAGVDGAVLVTGSLYMVGEARAQFHD
jgi:dihydrofolate synthase/folylpolyglutamate synthase